MVGITVSCVPTLRNWTTWLTRAFRPVRVDEGNGTALPTRMRACSLLRARMRGVDRTRTFVFAATALMMARTSILASRTSRMPSPWGFATCASPKLWGPNPMVAPRVVSPEVRTCQLIPHSLDRSSVTSTMSTSSSTWGGRTSSCSIVSRSSAKLGGAVRITSELVAWSGTIAVRPTRPRTSAWTVSDASRGAAAAWGITPGCWKDATSRCRMLRRSSERLAAARGCTRCPPPGPPLPARRPPRQGGAEQLAQRRRQLPRAGVLERVHVGPEPRFASRFDVKLDQQVHVARDADTTVRDEDGVGARHHLDARALARHLPEERHSFLRLDVLQRHDLGDQPEGRRAGELLPDPDGAGRRLLLLEHHLRHRPALHHDQPLALEDRLQHAAYLCYRDRLGGLEGDPPRGDVGQHDVHTERRGERADHVPALPVDGVDGHRLRRLFLGGGLRGRTEQRDQQDGALHGRFARVPRGIPGRELTA